MPTLAELFPDGDPAPELATALPAVPEFYVKPAKLGNILTTAFRSVSRSDSCSKRATLDS